MLLSFKKQFDYAGYLLIAFLVVFVNYCLLREREDLLYLSVAFSCLFLLALVFLFAKKYLIYISVFSIPLSIKMGLGSSGTVVSFPGEAMVGLLTLLLIGKSLSVKYLDKKILLHPLTLLLFLDLAWLVVASVFSVDPIVSAKRVIMRVGFVLVYFLLFAHWFTDRKNIPKFYLLYGFGSMFVIFAVFQNHSYYNFSVQSSYLVTQPFFADHTVYGAALAFLLPMLTILFFRSATFKISRLFQFILLIVIVLLMLALFLAFSRAALLSLVVSFIFYGLIKLKVKMRSFLALIAISVGIVAYSYEAIYNKIKENESVSSQPDFKQHLQSVTNVSTDNSNLERINRWICAIRMFKEKPLTGFGPGTYQFEYGKFQSLYEMTYLSTYHGDKGNAHSEFLTYLSETGLPGMINFTLIVLFTIATGFRVIYQTTDPQVKYLAIGILLGVVGYFFHGFFNSFMDQDKIAILIFGSMAALVALDIKRKNLDSKKGKIQETL